MTQTTFIYPYPLPTSDGSAFGPEIDLWVEGWNVIGIDEAGRGPLAGPVVAAACLFKPDVRIVGVADSKTLSSTRREELACEIREQAVSWAISEAGPRIIDEINILKATCVAMKQAANAVLRQCDNKPSILLIDGRIPDLGLGRQVSIVKGDQKSFSIGAASILAKVMRDHRMEALAQLYPGYGFEKHKGYPTKSHVEAVRNLGNSPAHRLTFHVTGWKEIRD